MFERYTEQSRRVIFFARYEASQYGSPYIETEHLLLGLLREDRAIGFDLLKLNSLASLENIRRDIEAAIERRERISTATEVPLTQECKRILTDAAEEADHFSDPHIGTEHLLLGILRQENCFAARLLTKYGMTLNDVREKLVTPGLKGHWRPERLTLPAQVPIGPAVDMVLEAWSARDAAKLASFFSDRGHFWDVHGELWSTPAQIEKGLTAHFASAEPRESAPTVKDVKFVTSEVSIATLTWQPKATQDAAASVPKNEQLGMVLVLRDTHPGWHIVSAHLAVMQLPKTSKKK